MDVNKRYEEAMAIVKEAVTADGEKKYPDALRLYGSAIERFLMAMECALVLLCGRFAAVLSLLKDVTPAFLSCLNSHCFQHVSCLATPYPLACW
jgi:hypothetical protein